MGGTTTPTGRHEWAIDVAGLDTVTEVTVVRDGSVIDRITPAPSPGNGRFDGVVSFGVGWGETGRSQDWDGTVRVSGGRIEQVEPRLHGLDTVDPLQVDHGEFHFSRWEQRAADEVRLVPRTHGNPTVTTDATQGMALRLVGDGDTVVELAAADGTDEVRLRATVDELRQ